MKLSVISKIVATSMLLASTTSIVFAAHHHHASYNYKGEFKDAVPCPTPPSLMDGFYVGAQAGYDSYRVRQTLSDDPFSGSSVNNVTGWLGGLFVGYGQYFNNYAYLGGELLGNYNGTSQTTNQFSFGPAFSGSQTFKAKGTWGLALIPGLKLNDTSLGYLRLGYDWTNFQGNASTTVAGVTTSTSQSKTLGGWDLGIGIETLLMNNWSVRTEYNHIWYNSYSSSTSGVSATNNVSDNQFNVGIVYHFS